MNYAIICPTRSVTRKVMKLLLRGGLMYKGRKVPLTTSTYKLRIITKNEVIVPNSDNQYYPLMVNAEGYASTQFLLAETFLQDPMIIEQWKLSKIKIGDIELSYDDLNDIITNIKKG